MFRKILSTAGVMAMLTGALSGLGALPASAAEITPTQPAMTTWYDYPATNWEREALPIGNGFIGGMVFGGVEVDRVLVNEHSIWSGGPGQNANYNGGHSGTAEAHKNALMQVRQILQERANDFRANKAAYIDENTGNVVAQDEVGYQDNVAADPTVNTPMATLKGEKGAFGAYQALGNIEIANPESATPRVTSATSFSASGSAEPTDGSGQAAANLFDGALNTKWFAGNSGRTHYLPMNVTWGYNRPFTFKDYKIGSANDTPGRDPDHWILYGSTTGTDGPWTKLHEVNREGQSFAARDTLYTFSLDQEVTYQYLKLEITHTQGYTGGSLVGGAAPQLSEIQLVPAGSSAETYTDYRRELSLDDALATVSYTDKGVNYKREYFTSLPGNIMAIRLSADAAGKITRQFALTSPHTNKTISASGDTITMTGWPNNHASNRGLKFAQQLKVINQGGTLTTNADGSIDVANADSVLLIMSAGTNYVQCMDDTFDYFSADPPLTAVSARVTAAAAKTWDALLAAHKADHQELFSRVQLNLGNVAVPEKDTETLLRQYRKTGNTPAEDRYLETLYYQFGRYLLIASSREGGLPANLQGIWAEGLSPPWSADYHTNINVQMNYWLAEQTNLAECHLPMISYVNAQVARGTYTAQQYHVTQEGDPVRGWAAYHENNIWGNTAPATSSAYYFPAGAAWMCQDIWEYYAFTQDKDFLAENFDTLLQAALFWVDNLWEDELTHKLVSNPSYSPEHGPVTMGASCDQVIIWELFREVEEAAAILNLSDQAVKDAVAEVAAAQEKLWLPAIGLGGEYLEWMYETRRDLTGDGNHRHVNHLYALHPGSLVVAGRSEEDDANVAAMKKVLNTRSDASTGWSMGWKINMWARLRDGDRAHKLLTDLFYVPAASGDGKGGTLPNLFDTHQPFQIDGNFGTVAGMTEMLLQSQGDCIELMAAVPSLWNTGSVTGLKARGNYTVDMAWTNSNLTGATIKANVGGTVSLRYPGLSAGKVTKVGGGNVTFTKVDNDTITFTAEPGASYAVTDVPANAKTSDPTDILGMQVNNIYSTSVANTVKLPADLNRAGTFVETIPAASFAASLGLKSNDVLVKYNGALIEDTDTLEALYANTLNGGHVILKVWRGDRYIQIEFNKSAANNALTLPARIEAEDWDEKSADAKFTNNSCPDGGENIGNVGTNEWAMYKNVNFDSDNILALEVRASGLDERVLTFRLDSPTGKVVGTVKVKTSAWDTYQTFESEDLDLEGVTGTHDVYLMLPASVNVNWFYFAGYEITPPEVPYTGPETPPEDIYALGDVNADTKIDSTDARLVLQFEVSLIDLTAAQQSRANVSGDDKVDSTDARMILQYEVHLLDKFPAAG